MAGLATPPEGIAMCERWEGWHKALPDGRAKPYFCPAKVATIGFGTTYWDDGRSVKISDDAITKEVGRQLLLRQLQRYADCVDRTIKVKMHPWMRASCVSLAYNIGTGAFAKSTLARRINAREWSGCPEAFKRYKIGGGRVLTGLLARRTDEAALFMRGVAKLTEVPAVTATPAQKTQTLSGVAPESFWEKIVRGILEGLGPRPAAIPG
jgi:lysozyme